MQALKLLGKNFLWGMFLAGMTSMLYRMYNGEPPPTSYPFACWWAFTTALTVFDTLYEEESQ